MISRTNISLKELREKMGEKAKNEITITPQQHRQMKKGLAERMKVRCRKEDERRQHIYK